MRVDVAEAFSPPRVTVQAKKFGLKAGEAWDLTTGWDFNIPGHRQKVEEYVDREKAAGSHRKPTLCGLQPAPNPHPRPTLFIPSVLRII